MTKETTLKLKKGMNKVTTGTFYPTVMHCDADGELDIVWKDGTTSTEAFAMGDDRDMEDVLSATVSSGTFSFSDD